jgi:hypothetical protein
LVTRADLILRIEDFIYGMGEVERPLEDVITLADTTTTTMTVANINVWKQSRYGEVVPADGSEGELVICAADAAAGAVTVRRGQRGTVAAAAAGLVARVNPKFTRKMISERIDEVITDALHPHVWYHSKRSLTFTDQDYIYDLADEDWMVIDIYQIVDDQKLVFPSGWWIEENLIDTTVGASGKVLRLRRIRDQTATVFYTARSRPVVADLASFPDPLANLIPWFVCALLMGGSRTIPARYDPNRAGEGEVQEGGPQRDWRFFEQKALLKRNELNIALRRDESTVRQPRFHPRRRRSW